MQLAKRQHALGKLLGELSKDMLSLVRSLKLPEHIRVIEPDLGRAWIERERSFKRLQASLEILAETLGIAKVIPAFSVIWRGGDHVLERLGRGWVVLHLNGDCPAHSGELEARVTKREIPAGDFEGAIKPLQPNE